VSSPLALFDWLIIGIYFIVLLILGFQKSGDDKNETTFLLSGRSITLLPFVATLVSTWYGGILGVGEYAFQYGISQWLLFGFPYYIFALLFAWFFAGKIRENKALTIPEAFSNVYGEQAGRYGAVLIFLLVNPAPYILMLGLMIQFMLGIEGSTTFYAGLIALFAVAYISFSGFSAVVRTDILQVISMFVGFLLLFGYAWSTAGSPYAVWAQLPPLYRDITGNSDWSYILVWFFIALWTFVDPGFHQRAAAAKTPETAKRGIITSVILWFGFDFLTVSCGLYSFYLLGDTLNEPILAYPFLAAKLLPSGVMGIFMVTLIATIMSTLDSFLFISGQTLGRDLLKQVTDVVSSNTLTRAAMAFSALLGILLLYLIPSVVELWYTIGSVIIPGLLIPVAGVYYPYFRVSRKYIIYLIVLSTLGSLVWLLAGNITGQMPLLQIEPFYPGLAVSVLIWQIHRKRSNSSGGFKNMTQV